MVRAQKYLDEHYPYELRSKVNELDLRNLNLEGELDIKDFTDLSRINISGNPLLGEIKNKSY
jgi:hypothetical protein